MAASEAHFWNNAFNKVFSQRPLKVKTFLFEQPAVLIFSLKPLKEMKNSHFTVRPLNMLFCISERVSKPATVS